MADWLYILWILIFGEMVVIAVGGNILVISLTAANREMQNATNHLIINLCIADLIMAVFNCVFNLVYMMQKDWPFGETYCGINNFIANVSVAASVFSLMAISLDRYSCIAHPFDKQKSHRTAFAIISCIWIISCSLAVPCIIYSATIPYSVLEGNTQTACVLVWPDGVSHYSKTDYVYNMAFLAATYAVPLLCMGIWYTIICRILWRKVETDGLNETLHPKRKLARIFMTTVVLFAVCWLPYHVYFIWGYHDNSLVYFPYAQHIYLGLYWFAMSSSMVNPIVYYIASSRFRKHCQRALCCFRRDKRTKTAVLVTGTIREEIPMETHRISAIVPL